MESAEPSQVGLAKEHLRNHNAHLESCSSTEGSLTSGAQAGGSMGEVTIISVKFGSAGTSPKYFNLVDTLPTCKTIALLVPEPAKGTSSSSSTEDSGGGSSVGLIVGVIIGVLVLVGLAIGGYFYYNRVKGATINPQVPNTTKQDTAEA